MKLIVNADDFGLSKGTNYGIIDAYQNGLVRSTTIMPGMKGFEHAVSLAKKYPDLRIGIHLNLTMGKSIGTGYKTITDEQGNFLNQLVLRDRLDSIDLDEVEREYELQIKTVKEAGILFDHFDSHHHTHMLSGIIDIFFKLADKYKVGARLSKTNEWSEQYKNVTMPDKFEDSFYDKAVTIDSLKDICMKHIACDVLEIMCHPAYLDPYLYQNTRYNVKRLEELEVLTSDEVKQFIKENSITLGSYSD